jgi:anti-sigma factor RsiW
MDCGTFRDNHAAYIDGVASSVELGVLQRHAAECAACAAHDAAVRRAILLFRNMPPIQPSPDFAPRLRARLRQARAEQRRAALAGQQRHRGPGVAAFVGLAAGVIAVGYVSMSAFDRAAPANALALDPVVATASAAEPSLAGFSLEADSDADLMTPLATPAFVASVSTGIPAWPETVLAARAPARVAAAQLKLTSLGR